MCHEDRGGALKTEEVVLGQTRCHEDRGGAVKMYHEDRGGALRTEEVL